MGTGRPRKKVSNKAQSLSWDGIRDHKGLATRFLYNITKRSPDECWEWTGHRGKYGYGEMSVKFIDQERTPLVRTHRVSFLLHRGDIPQGKVVCHHCDNPKCVSPYHLYLGTVQDNARDWASKLPSDHVKRYPCPEAKTVSLCEIAELREAVEFPLDIADALIQEQKMDKAAVYEVIGLVCGAGEKEKR